MCVDERWYMCGDEVVMRWYMCGDEVVHVW